MKKAKNTWSKRASSIRSIAVKTAVCLAFVFPFFDTLAATSRGKTSHYSPSPLINTALTRSVEAGNKGKVHKLLKRGANPNWRNTNSVGDPLLLIAINRGFNEIVELLLAYGANPETKDSRGTPILIAAASLLSKGKEPIPVLRAIRTLLRKKAHANAADTAYIGDGRSALHVAASNGAFLLTKLLIKYGANPNIRNDYNETPLFFASERGHLKIVKFLVLKRAELNYQSRHMRKTPLMAAAYAGHVRVVKYLIQKNANLVQRDRFGKSALDLAKTAFSRLPISARPSHFRQTIRFLQKAERQRVRRRTATLHAPTALNI